MGNLVGNGQLPVTGEDNHVTHQRPLWVKSRRFATTLKMSAFGGKADIILLSLLELNNPVFLNED